MSETYRQISRKEFTPPFGEERSIEDVKAGAMQRIADAMEVMAGSYSQLIRDRDFYKQQSESRGRDLGLANRRIASLKGQITLLRRRVATKAAEALS